MKGWMLGMIAVLGTIGAPLSPVHAADDSKVKAATRQVETGAREIGAGDIGEGIADTAKGVGHTVAEGAKYAGEKLQESARAAEPEAKSAWGDFRDATVAFGRSVKNFFKKLGS
jgi:hypothetical protein